MAAEMGNTTTTSSSASDGNADVSATATATNSMAMFMVRHGERVDETPGAIEWAEATPTSRHFDPPLTDAGAEQAAQAAETLLAHPLGPDFGTTIYASPLARCLKTASVIAEATNKQVCVVPGLGECAAAAKRRGIMALNLLPIDEMKKLCPQMVAFDRDAPVTFEDACQWAARARAAEAAAAAIDAADGRSVDVLVVTHREGIRDVAGIHQRLPYCAIARFTARANVGTSVAKELNSKMGDASGTLVDGLDFDEWVDDDSEEEAEAGAVRWDLAELTDPSGASCMANKPTSFRF